MLNVVTSLALTTVIVGAPTRDDPHSFSEPAAAKLQIRNGSGRVQIVAADVDAFSVVATVRGDDVTIDRERSGDTFYLRTKCPRLGWFSRCSVDYKVTVPRRTALGIHTGSGDIKVTGAEGKAKLRTGSGDIDLTSLVSPEVTVRVGSGDVNVDSSSVDSVRFDQGSGRFTARGLRSRKIRGETHSGRIDMDMIGPAPRQVDLHTGSGDVRLQVPQRPYAMKVDTGSGEVKMDRIQIDRAADHKISIDTGSGDVEVTGDASSEDGPG